MKVNISECNSPVAGNIVRIIKEKGVKHVSVARKAGYESQMFSDMLNGRRLIKVSDIVQIAEALEVDVGCLFQKEGELDEES